MFQIFENISEIVGNHLVNLLKGVGENIGKPLENSSKGIANFSSLQIFLRGLLYPLIKYQRVLNPGGLPQ
jgi:hypothetical protein